MEKALFGAGCFWGVEETFCKTPGVINTLVGYSGGDTINPSYESVCQGNTNHTEVVLVEFDNSKISYEDLLMVFWKCHDPTTLNRQGPTLEHNIDQRYIIITKIKKINLFILKMNMLKVLD